MLEYPRSPLPPAPLVKICGIGNAGCNILDRLTLDGFSGPELLAFNTDLAALSGCVAERKVQLGPMVTHGFGTGGDPELGRQSAKETLWNIREAISGAQVVILVAGLGGGTASGGMQRIVETARDEGAHVIVVATLPFSFEGRRRQEQAAECLVHLEQSADLLICIENDRMADLAPARAGVQEAFAVVDGLLSQCIRSLASLGTRRGPLHAGFDEIASVFHNSALRGLFGYGEATGDNRAHEAAEALLKSPFLHRGTYLGEIHAAMVHVSGGPDLTIHEVQTVAARLRRYFPEEAPLYYGIAVDESLSGRLVVTALGALPPTTGLAEVTAVLDEYATPEAAEADLAEAPSEPATDSAAEPAYEPAAASEPLPIHMRPMVATGSNIRRASAPEPEVEPDPESGHEEEEPLAIHPSRPKPAGGDSVNRGRFEKSEPTIIDGEDLDVPTFLRRNVRLTNPDRR